MSILNDVKSVFSKFFNKKEDKLSTTNNKSTKANKITKYNTTNNTNSNSTVNIDSKDEKDEKQSLDDKHTKKNLLLAFNVIKEFIPHFCNFNLDLHQSTEIIEELASKIQLSNEIISYFVTYLNSSIYSIKSNKYNNLNINSNNINKSFKIKEKAEKLSIFIMSSLYLNNNDLKNLFALNKYSNKKLERCVYKTELLKEDISIKTRIIIWKKILKCVRFYIFT